MFHSRQERHSPNDMFIEHTEVLEKKKKKPQKSLGLINVLMALIQKEQKRHKAYKEHLLALRKLSVILITKLRTA